MQPIRYIKKKINGSYLIWFQNSNQYIQFEEPAWFVFQETLKKNDKETIARKAAKRYKTSYESSLAFVTEIESRTEKLNRVVKQPFVKENFRIGLNCYSFKHYSSYQYKLGRKLVLFVYESLQLENFIHPLLNNLKTSDWLSTMHIFELFTFKEHIVFRFNGEVKGVWNKDEAIYVKGLIFMYLINEMHDKKESDWLMTVHASAISNDKKTMLFSAAPGRGKTTIAALLHAKGFKLVSDDFVPIDKKFKAYSFPISMSVKEGSVELLSPVFPGLEQIKLNYISPEKSVRYLPNVINQDILDKAFPVRDLIFIEYNKNNDFSFEKVDKFQSIKLLLEESWINSSKENVFLLFDWIKQTNFYKLRFSDNQKALDAITNLFRND